jgi:transcriptional regulator with XRE-family HTH domain
MAPQHAPPTRINGETHRVLREKSGYSTITAYTRALARLGGVWVNGQHISNIEKGSRNPSDELFAAMVHVLKVPPAVLLRCPGCPGCRRVRGDSTCPVCKRIADDIAANGGLEVVTGQAA